MLTNSKLNLSVNIELINLKSFKEKILGATVFNKSSALFFKTRFGIHTFFMKFPLDIVILNKNNRVVKLKEQLKPNKIFFWNPRYENVLELPAGSIKKLKLKNGNILKFNL